MLQSPRQPSPSAVLPSSHSSPLSTTPSPQAASRQPVARHALRVRSLFAAPSSHSSPAAWLTMWSPQRATVQPLLQLYADHFASPRPDGEGPSPQKLAEALAKVGRAGLLVSEDRIALARRGAAVTLNGIAQGYATDRVVERLREAGLSTTLVNIGEIRAIGARPEGTPWRVGLADPERPGALTETVDLVDRAVATSAGAGFRFDSKGRFTHLFDPTTGRSPSRYSTVSVMAPTATEADALSTAFSLMPLSRIEDIVDARPNVQARITDSCGTLIVCGA